LSERKPRSDADPAVERSSHDEQSKDSKDAPKERVSDRTYTHERLVNEPDALGQPSYVIAGALASVEDEEITLEQARKEIKRYLAE
jgi:hypothetical protein